MADRGRMEVRLTDEAYFAYVDLPSDAVLARVDSLLETLGEFPWFGQEYDPAYPAARPPVPCRVAFCGRYGIYYRVLEDEGAVEVLAIEDQRRDPRSRFRRL